MTDGPTTGSEAGALDAAPGSVAAAVALLLATVPSLTAADPPAAERPAPAASQELRFDSEPEQRQRRWLIRLRLKEQRVLRASVDGQRRPMRLWASPGGRELLLHRDDLTLVVDTGHRRVFQLRSGTLEEPGEVIQVRMPYPLPKSDRLLDEPQGGVELTGVELELDRTLVPLDAELQQALESSRSGAAYRPNVQRREYQRVYRLRLETGGREVEVLLETFPE